MIASALMIERAYALEDQGLLRRAGTIWQNVLRHPLVKDNEFELAKAKLLKYTALISQKENTRYHSTTPGRLQNIEEDKEKIFSLLRTEATVKEIMLITRRSQSYIYKCRKEFQNNANDF
ncbi:hypothetical protein BBG21_16705 [Salmonella enterica]|nr:hypothetical protein [Salmonella enterica]